MSEVSKHSVLRWQVFAVSIVGAVAVICFLLSLVLEPSAASVFNTIAGIAGVTCGLIGVSFAFTGRARR